MIRLRTLNSPAGAILAAMWLVAVGAGAVAYLLTRWVLS